MRRPELQHQLVLLAEVDLLAMTALRQIPDVDLVAVLAGKQDLGVDAALDHLGRAPLARDRGVVTEVPPEVVGELLRSAVDLPSALDRESVVVDHEDSTGRVAVRIAERTDVDPIGTAVDCVRPAVAGAVGNLLGLDRVDELRLLRIGLDVEDVDARRAKARHQQVPALEMRVRSVGTQGGAAHIPAEVVELIAYVGRVDAADLFAESL